MSANTLNLVIGTASARAEYAADLGKTVTVNGKRYRLVKAAATIASASGMALVSAQSGGLPTFSVNTSTTANDPTIIGIVPVGQVGSTGTTSIQSGDYFYVQVAGFAQVKCTAGTIAGDLLSASATAGSLATALAAGATTFSAGTFKGACAVTLEAVAATLAGHVGVRLCNLD